MTSLRNTFKSTFQDYIPKDEIPHGLLDDLLNDVQDKVYDIVSDNLK